ncbi:reverse transcriptase, partial [Tanacetum coccineum]
KIVVATRNTHVGNNPAEEESVRDILLRMQGSIHQLTYKIAIVETSYVYLNNEFTRLTNGEGYSRQYSRMTKVDNVDDNVKVKLASIHLYDKALAWHRQFEKVNGEFASWELYETAIYKRFGPCYKDPMEEIKNLRQEGTVSDYQDKFEALISRVELTESQAISCFLSGLQQDIGLLVKMFKPKTLYDAYQLTRMQETLRTMNTKMYTPILPTPKHSINTVTTNRNATYNARPPTTQLALPSTPFNKSVSPVQAPQLRLSQKENEEKRAKNLCFYCDKKYVPWHKCSGHVFSIEFLGEDKMQDNVEELEEQVTEEVVAEPVIYPYISLNDLAGVNTFHTMRIKGHVGKQDIHILVDSGSTHNFVDVLYAKRLGCEIRSIFPLQVEVSGGNQMLSTSTCRQFTWTLQGQNFTSDVMLLPLEGCDMVLGVQWLSTLGDIKWNFHTLWMEFTFMGRKVTLRAMSLCVYPTTLMAITGKKEFTNAEGHTLTELLASFEDVFAISNTLLPHRTHNHRIVLQEGAPLINIRPYKHPPTQKDAIELMVKELLETRVIRPSHSPFSSPIVMVKKKDGTWRMCMDYKKLNVDPFEYRSYYLVKGCS